MIGARSRHDVVDRALGRTHHLGRRQLGQPPGDRVVERHEPFVDQEHQRRGGDRLRHRRDAHDRVRSDVPDGPDLDVVTASNEPRGARHDAAPECLLEELRESRHHEHRL